MECSKPVRIAVGNSALCATCHPKYFWTNGQPIQVDRYSSGIHLELCDGPAESDDGFDVPRDPFLRCTLEGFILDNEKKDNTKKPQDEVSDVELVMSQTNASHEEAKRELERQNGDIVDAIGALLDRDF